MDQNANKIQQCFSGEKQPTLWCALPAIEQLQTAWEAKHNNPKYAIYRMAIDDGLKKITKYYSHFDEKPAYVLALSKSYHSLVTTSELRASITSLLQAGIH